MAAPFLLVAALPRLATKLPRPGRWMTIVKPILGLALIGTALWLLSILAFQVNPASAYFLAALMALAVAILFVRTRLPAALRPAAVADRAEQLD
jgi:suppressor for copper-sensitivity B